MTDLYIGQVIRFSEAGHREGMLWCLSGGQGGWFIDIDDGKAAPILRLSNEVEELLAEGLLTAAEDT